MSKVMYYNMSDDVKQWVNRHLIDCCYIGEFNNNELMNEWSKYKDNWKSINDGFLITVGKFYQDKYKSKPLPLGGG